MRNDYVTPKEREHLAAYLKKFYSYQVNEKYTIFDFIRFFKKRHKGKMVWFGHGEDKVKRRVGSLQTLLLVSGTAGCFSEDTIIKSNNQSLGELWDSGKEWINTKSILKTGEQVDSLSKIIPSGEKEVYELELDDGRIIHATKEHIFFKKGFKETKLGDLKIGQSIITE